MNAIAVMEPVDFHGDTLWGRRNEDGAIMVAMRPICAALGLDWGSQFKRINRDAVLSSTVVIMTTVAEDGKTRETVCLPLDYLNGWLFGVDDRRVRAEIRDRVLDYKRECYRVLDEYFRPAMDETAARHGATVPGPADLASLPPDLISRYLDVVREARRLGGRAAAVRIWNDHTQLPPLFAGAALANPLADFLAAATTPDPAGRIPANWLYAAYQRWCAENSAAPLTGSAFGRRMSETEVERVKHGTMFYCGISLREDFAAR